MCGVVERLEVGLPEGAIVKRCSAEGCNVPLKDAPKPHLVMDLDHDYFDLKDEIHCDFLFVSCECNGGTDWVVPLELKGGELDATEIKTQLQAGSNFAQALIPEDHKSRFRPVGVYGGRLHKFQRDKLRRARILYRRKRYEVKLIRGGTPLKVALT